MPTANVNGLRLNYELHGDDGEPLVFVHGYTGDVTDWRHQVADFARTHRVLAMDHRGHGASDAPDDLDAYTILNMADDVEALIAHVGFDRYHLVGHSMGGSVSQEIALRSPGRIMSLTLEDTGPGFDIKDNEVVMKYINHRFELARTKGMRAVAEMPSLPRPPHWPLERTDEERERMSRMPIAGFIGAWGAMTAWAGTRERAHQIAAPTMVIYGELDAMVIEGMKFLESKVPGATGVVIPQAGHSPQYERPDLFNEAVRRHVQRNASGPAK